MLIKLLSFLSLFLGINSAYADDGGIGSVSEGLYSLVSVASQALSYILLLVGLAFCIGAAVQYKAHRDNPSQVRLSTPVFYLVLGLLALILPFAYFVVGYDPGVSL